MRNALFVFAFVVLGLLAIPILLVCMLFGRREAFIAYGVWMMDVGRRVLGIEVDVRGFDGLDHGRPCVFMANHESFLDGPLLMTVLDRPVRAVVKRFVVDIPVMGPGMRFVGYVPVEKGGAGAGRASILRAAAAVKKRGYSFLVFPEGTRSWDGVLLPFRRGGFFLALDSGAPIVPVTIRGTYALMPRGRWLVRKGRVRVVFHPPVSVMGNIPETLTELMNKVRAAISAP
ncbi:MAG: 1-acyl-sn-glycerol-3-phosphate acyltransferase [Candidatus Aminicenantes bacterium]|nr:1-acyl-sn-glycerol-3-phosphate acyltransferase [Candidatus Aminicenantes bacterium]